MNDQHGKGTAVAAQNFDLAELVKDLRKQVTLLEDDLRARSEEVEESATALRTEYDEAFAAKRIAATYEAWRDDRVTQVAAAWVLGTVFVRYCEDNDLIEWPFIAGPGEKLIDAEERHEKFFREHPELNDRDWIVEAFNHLAGTNPTVAGLFDKQHNPLWEIMPSFEAATALLGFWRRRGDDGEIRYDFTGSDTRFLGDLYQEISLHAQKTFALLQTPVFVEEFILDLTLEPAIKQFGLKGLRTIDPACGSGHFLLGLFHRILNKWHIEEPGTDIWKLIRRTLDSVHGCDKNPFAVLVARFRLLRAVMLSANITRLDQVRQFPLNIAIGDSLMHGEGIKNKQDDLFSSTKKYAYRTEDVDDFVNSCQLLKTSSYHAVVGNPPYITVKDKQENSNYRERYSACAGTYALSVPFAQRLFQLAIRSNEHREAAGFVGQITASSFTKNAFGKRLIEAFFPTIQLNHIIDTAGARIPGHGTPTVIIVGQNRRESSASKVRMVRGIRAEPGRPKQAAEGHVWLAILNQINQPDSESEWISVEDIQQIQLAKHPWSLAGGGAAPIVTLMEQSGRRADSMIEPPVGRAIRAGADDAFIRPLRATLRTIANRDAIQPLLRGEVVRDWNAVPSEGIWYPYHSTIEELEVSDELWPWRSLLAARRTFHGDMEDAGLKWWHYMQHTESAYRTSLSIVYAAQATHNHFTLDRGGSIFKQSAPVIKLKSSFDKADYLSLTATLNSSMACFWLRAVSSKKGGSGEGRGVQDEPWEERFVLNGMSLERFPLPSQLPLELGRMLDDLAHQHAEKDPHSICTRTVPTASALNAAKLEYDHTRRQMIALQEELDWLQYKNYNLINSSEFNHLAAFNLELTPKIDRGERAFEIVLARKALAGKENTSWFTRHSSTPITEIPSHWPEWYQQIVEARIDIIEKRKDIALIERPEYKRRWATEPWEKMEAEALRTWLLDRCETKDIWFTLRDGMKQPRTLTVSQLADQFRDDADMNSVAQLYAADHLGKRDLTLAQVLEQVVADQHVPYLAAMRYKDTGLRKRGQWERVWEMQREEDRTGERLDIPVPPKYGNPDFRKTSYWSQRGKLDVPKERFISYPDANPDADPTLLLGWAGWDHKDQAQALVNIINDRVEQSGWGTDKLTPLLAGLRELMPWVRQWHGEYDDAWGGTPSEEYQTFLDDQRTKQQLTEDDLRAWRPVAGKRRQRATTKDDQQ